MNTSWLPRAALAALLAGMLPLAGCVVTPAHVYVGGTVAIAPPAPIVEVQGLAPGPGYVWFGGYWGWREGRHYWVPGGWHPGRPGYRWVPHHWVAAGGGWRLEQGHWER